VAFTRITKESEPFCSKLWGTRRDADQVAWAHLPSLVPEAGNSAHVCPGISIHAIDIIQPPGIGISPIADMDTTRTRRS
jgi:hypothetical protein